MPKAMIITVGAQGEQIIYSIKEIKPEFLGLLATNTPECKNVVLKACESIPRSNCRIEYVEDNPAEICRLIEKFNQIYEWLKRDEKLTDDEIVVDPTGGRKWMSAGSIMIASHLGLEMIYVDVKYEKGKPDPETMKIIEIGNAYSQAGFLEEEKADKLFNENNFSEASNIYYFLSTKVSAPRKFYIKKDICDAYLQWSQFRFKPAYDKLKSAVDKIHQYGILKDLIGKLEKQVAILSVLSNNDEVNAQFFQLLKNDDFTKEVLLTLIAQSERFEQNGQFDQGVITLYRILELLGQYRLAKKDINANDVPEKIRSQYNEQFKQLTKKLYQSETEIPKKISLIQCWSLLFLLKDETLKSETEKFLIDLRDKTNVRNLLWLEHGNKHATQKELLDFKKFVLHRVLKRVIPNWEDMIENYQFLKFEN